MKNNTSTFIVKASDKERETSQSGGIFSVLAKFVLLKGGIVYGCSLENEKNIIHIRISNIDELIKLKGSKYVQSDIKNCYKKIMDDLIAGKVVLFSGTPCQTEAIKKYLICKKVQTKNLILVDIICHGVPSPGVWKDYLDYLEKKYGQVKNYNFRNKKFGWKSSISTFNSNEKEIIDQSYTTLYYYHFISRESCFNCHFKNLNRKSDITIGDSWSAPNHKLDEDFLDSKGVSLVIVNTMKGMKIFENCLDELCIKKIKMDNYLQPALCKNYDIPKNREKFWKDYKKKNMGYILWRYGGNNIFKKMKRIIKKIINKLRW